MPLYDFRNKDTGEIFEKNIRLADYDSYLKDNPNIERYFANANRLMDEFSLGRKKPDGRWFDKLEKIKEANPGHKMNETRFERTREI